MLGPCQGATRPKHEKALHSHMIAKLFRRLTADPEAGAALFDVVTRAARERGWYVEGSVPDTINGRFAVVSTVTALCCLRLEQLGKAGEALSVALTERFAEVMESEHRELGIGDPTLGKTVLRLVGSLARRVDALRPALAGDMAWSEAADTVFPSIGAGAPAGWRARQLELLAGRLQAASVDQLARGNMP
jgi:cytochrome b pre-mRNA-processing protein 3